MDRLTAFVCIAHLRLRLDILKRNPHLLESAAMTPKLQGVLQSFNLLKHNLEADADDLAKRIQDADQRRVSLKQNSHAALGKVGSDMGDIEEFLGAMEGSNGAPLESSSASSQPSADASAEPAAPVVAEHLTVNGVSQS